MLIDPYINVFVLMMLIFCYTYNKKVFTLAQKQALDLLRWGKQPATVHIVANHFH